MIRIVLACSLATVVLSQCPQEPQRCNSGESDDDDSGFCPDVPTIDRRLSDLANDQPLKYTFFPNTKYLYQLDNVCITLFPLFDSSEKYIIYESQVYCDGSNKVQTYIGVSNGTGTNDWADPDQKFTNYIIDYLECGTYVKYRCNRCGGTGDDSFLFGMVPISNSSTCANSNSTLSVACLRQATELVSSQGLDTDNYFRLPNQLPFQCIYQHRCQSEDSPIYCQENGSCQAYES